MKRLVRQNRGVTNVEIQKTGIKDFDRYAKRYHIDYSIQKDLSCKPPRYLVYFKAQDTDALIAAFKEYSASVLDKTKRPSVLAKLHDLAQSVANLPDKVRHKQRSVAYEQKEAFQAAGTLSALCGLLAVATTSGEAWRLAEGKELGDKIVSLMGTIRQRLPIRCPACTH